MSVHPLVAGAASVWNTDSVQLSARIESLDPPTARPRSQIERFIRDYYHGKPLPEGYSYYDRAGRRPAAIWKAPGGIIQAEDAQVAAEAPFLRIAELDHALAPLRHLTRTGAQLWNDQILRLHSLDFAAGTAQARFTSGRFFDYRFTTGLLGDEAALGEHKLRDALMPGMTDFHERFTAGGMQALVAIARPAPYDDFAIPLQVRGTRVSDAHGLHGVIPMAYHQPLHRNGQPPDARALTLALREFAEELCGLDEAQAADFETLPEIAALQREAILEITGFTLNLVNGNYDYTVLICHQDPAYWENYASRWSPNWEAERVFLLSTRDHGTFHRLISQADWVPQSLVALFEGVDRLRAIDPSRCAIG